MKLLIHPKPPYRWSKLNQKREVYAKVLIKGHWGDGYLSVRRVFTQFTTFQLMTVTLVSKKGSRADDEDSTGRLANQRLLNAHYC